MAITTLTSREFNHDTGRAKKATAKGPVFITDRGRPSHVLLSIEEYQQISAKPRTLLDALAMDEEDTFEFDPPRLEIDLVPAEFD